MKKNKKNNFTALLIISIIGVGIWILFTVYFTLTGTEINPEAESYNVPIQGEFNQDILDATSEKIKEVFPIQPEFLQDYELETVIDEEDVIDEEENGIDEEDGIDEEENGN